MQSKFIEVCDVRGNVESYCSLEDFSELSRMNNAFLFAMKKERMVEMMKNDPEELEENRIIMGKSVKEKELLLNLDPVRVYVRFPDMTSIALNVNPYHTVKWLKQYIRTTQSLNFDMKFILNGKEMAPKSSLIEYVYENAIIHILDVGSIPETKFIDILYVKEPGKDAKTFEINQLALEGSIGELSKKVSVLLDIPEKFLYIFYTGRLLKKKQNCSAYNIKNGSYLYAVDGRKYLKVMPKSQYEQRVKEVRKKTDGMSKLLLQKPEEKIVPIQLQENSKIQTENVEDKEEISIQKTDKNEFYEQEKLDQEKSEQTAQNLSSNTLPLFISEKISFIVDSFHLFVKSGSLNHTKISQKQSSQQDLAQGDFSVTIIDNENQKSTIIINISDCIDDLIQKYAAARNIPSKKIEILLNGSVLEEYEMVNELQICSNSNLFALIKH